MGIFVKRRSPLISVTLVCAVISIVRLYRSGDVPILTLTLGKLYPTFSYFHKPQSQPTSLYRQKKLFVNVTQNCECTCQSTNGDKEVRLQQELGDDKNTTDKLVPYVAPGPSLVQELVPMEVLKKKVSFSERDGLQYLDHTSLSHYYQCSPSTNPLLPTHIDKQCHKRSFLSQRQPLTALVSFHGSGNTWVRYLLEQATGIFTGSIYCDGVLKVTCLSLIIPINRGKVLGHVLLIHFEPPQEDNLSTKDKSIILSPINVSFIRSFHHLSIGIVPRGICGQW